MTGQIIVLPTGYDPEGDEAVVTRDRQELDACRHREVAIDEEKHRLVCRRCDEEIDPLTWIERLASDWQWYSTRVELAKRRAKEAEESAERRVQAAKRAASVNARMPMALGRRLGRIARAVGRAQGDLSEAFVSLAEVHDSGRAGLADHYLSAASEQIARARSSLAKLERDHGRKVESA